MASVEIARSTVDPADIEDVRSRGDQYGPEVIDMALLTVAMCGSIAEATRQLKVEGINVHERTVSDWRTKYPNRYRDLAERHRSTIEQALIGKVRGLVMRSAEVANDAVELEARRVKKGEVRDPSTTVRNLATSIGIWVDKILLLEGRPTHIHENRSSEEVLQGLVAKGYVESTADELPVNDESPA